MGTDDSAWEAAGSSPDSGPWAPRKKRGAPDVFCCRLPGKQARAPAAAVVSSRIEGGWARATGDCIAPWCPADWADGLVWLTLQGREAPSPGRGMRTEGPSPARMASWTNAVPVCTVPGDDGGPDVVTVTDRRRCLVGQIHSISARAGPGIDCPGWLVCGGGGGGYPSTDQV